MGVIVNRRRVMGSVSSPYDQFGYIKDGKTFHLDGINIGNNADAWTDLVGGIVFPIVNGVNHNNNHFSFASTHGYMESNPRTQLEFSTAGTLEIVCVVGNNMGVIFTGKNNSIGCIFYDNLLTPMMWRAHNRNTYNMDSFVGQATQISFTIDDAHANGTQLAAYSSSSMNVNASYCVIGNGNDGMNRPYVGDIYSIRYYNRVLTTDERANNIAVDRMRFNLALS